MATLKEKARALVAAKMKPMALTKKELAERDTPTVAPSPGPKGKQYPWGLSISLDDATMKKLGIKELEAGQTVTLAGKAKVTRCSEVEDESGERCDCTIQITALALTPSRTARMRKDD